MTGVAPDLPDSGWEVDHLSALKKFLVTDPAGEVISAVVEWVKGCKLCGPPADAVHVADDRYVALIPSTKVMADYFVVEFEFLMVIRDFH